MNTLYPLTCTNTLNGSLDFVSTINPVCIMYIQSCKRSSCVCVCVSIHHANIEEYMNLTARSDSLLPVKREFSLAIVTLVLALGSGSVKCFEIILVGTGTI